MHPNHYDTIELVENHPSDLHNGDVLNKGYLLTFNSNGTRVFWLIVQANNTNSCYVTIYPNTGGQGTIQAQLLNGKWNWADYKDSAKIGTRTLQDLLYFNGAADGLSNFVFVKHLGLTAYWSQGYDGVKVGTFVLVNTFKK
jgi:hypothetical protein